MSLPVSPPARRVFAAIVFEGGAPSFDWQRTTEQARESLSSVSPGTTAFGGSWSHTQMVVQEDLVLKKQGRIVETSTEVRH